MVVNSTFQKFLEHFSGFWRKFAIHHQTAKLQDDDIRWVKLNPERGTVSDVEDFSENDHIKPKREHASRYFSEVGYTLFGMVMTGHLDDFKTSARPSTKSFVLCSRRRSCRLQSRSRTL